MQCTCRQGEAPRLLPWYRQRGHPRNYACAGVMMIVQGCIFLVPFVTAGRDAPPIFLGIFLLALAFAALLFGVAWYKSSHVSSGWLRMIRDRTVPTAIICMTVTEKPRSAAWPLRYGIPSYGPYKTNTTLQMFSVALLSPFALRVNRLSRQK